MKNICSKNEIYWKANWAKDTINLPQPHRLDGGAMIFPVKIQKLFLEEGGDGYCEQSQFDKG